jgi:hypothetical protein
MTMPGMTPSDPETGTWIVRVGMLVIGFFLCLGVRDAKKSLDMVPALKAKVDEMEKAQDALFRRLEKLEGR